MKLRHGARRLGISEIVGSLLAIAITIIAGAGVFGYVNSQAKASESQYGSAAGATYNYLQEQFTVVDMSFTSGSQVTLYIYDYGNIAVSPVQVIIYDSAQATYLAYNATKIVSTKPSSCQQAATPSYENPLMWNPKTSSGMSVSAGYISALTLTFPGCSGASFSSGTTYLVKITGLYGNTITYAQVKP